MSLDFGFNDLYPGGGLYNTRATTVPEDADQDALVEGDVNNDVPNATAKSIWGSILLVVSIIVFLGMVRR